MSNYVSITTTAHQKRVQLFKKKKNTGKKILDGFILRSNKKLKVLACKKFLTLFKFSETMGLTFIPLYMGHSYSDDHIGQYMILDKIVA